MKLTVRERFESKFSPDPATGCWVWHAFRNPKGYGMMTFSGADERRFGRRSGAHRVSYVLNVGPIPEGRYVLHKCDNPPCVNPDHLYVGTTQDNADDRMLRGRHRQRDQAHCVHGHPFSAENTLITRAGKRHCRECGRRRALAYWRSKHGAAP